MSRDQYNIRLLEGQLIARKYEVLKLLGEGWVAGGFASGEHAGRRVGELLGRQGVGEGAARHAQGREHEVVQELGEGPTADVDRARGDRFVHRHRGVAVPLDAGAVPERFGEEATMLAQSVEEFVRDRVLPKWEEIDAQAQMAYVAFLKGARDAGDWPDGLSIEAGAKYLGEQIALVRAPHLIEVLVDHEVIKSSGFVGNFKSTVACCSGVRLSQTAFENAT